MSRFCRSALLLVTPGYAKTGRLSGCASSLLGQYLGRSGRPDSGAEGARALPYSDASSFAAALAPPRSIVKRHKDWLNLLSPRSRERHGSTPRIANISALGSVSQSQSRALRQLAKISSQIGIRRSATPSAPQHPTAISRAKIARIARSGIAISPGQRIFATLKHSSARSMCFAASSGRAQKAIERVAKG